MFVDPLLFRWGFSWPKRGIIKWPLTVALFRHRQLGVVAYPYATKGNSLYNRMAVNKKRFLTWLVSSFQAFQTLVKAPSFLFIYLKYRALIVNPFSSVQDIWFEFFYHHCRRICPIFKTDIVLFAALETAVYIIIRISKYYNHIIIKCGRLFKGILQ